MVIYFQSCHDYPAMLALGKEIHLILVCAHFLFIVLFKSNNHIFLPIALFNPSCDLYDLSSNILMLN